jgi:hypothetical protein
MKKQNIMIVLLIIISIIATIGVAAWLNLGPNLFSLKGIKPQENEVIVIPSQEEALLAANEATGADQIIVEDEEAERVGFQFILDFIEVGPPSMDQIAADRAYQALSSNAQASVNQETLSRDLAMFVGVQDMPDQGVSVENLVLNEDGNAILTVGLNYSGGRALRDITLIKENDEWKVDAVAIVEEFE